MGKKVNMMRDELKSIANRPDHSPFGLSGRFYTSRSYFKHEKATVLAKGWHCLGRADEIPDAGDYFTTQILHEPLLVVRNDDGAVRVFSNVCRHRAMPVAEGQGNRKLFVCSYHAWSYGRDGRLVRAANMENTGFDKATCRLPVISSEVWQGFIYANLDDDAEPLAPQLVALEELVGPYNAESFRIVHSAEEEWLCNWKCLVENFMEGYHLSVVHPETLRGYTPTELCTKAASGDAFTSYHANYPESIQSRGNGAPGLDQEQRHRSALYNVFPTQVVSQSASLLVSLSLRPLSVDRIKVRWTMSVYGDDLTEEIINERIALWGEVNREDREKLERLQLALGSSRAVAGPLASDNFEGTIHDFHKFLARPDGVIQRH